ncbi:carboxymuconolactone decarboxylase family protein [Neptuniibacter sp.]|uniref:carboxymuconolactone decarboxylase family protein n=1 Tax=Neptuniibacter sp. TaxID=1962643 RepID=UPI00261A99FB|nr:carboxymuconolactone decarboxylase family protein [Neptuniibacter sp.]MCP4598034.1 carboxymuconolactone decarboxylase family protein [Neptuniibacter sp.]
MAHLRPLENHEVDQELQDMFTHYENTRGFCPNSVKTMARRPEISKTFGKLNQVILYEGTVPEELKMLVALASSLASGCRYCQSHMSNLSSIYKAPDEKIAAIWEFETSDLFTEAERAAITVGIKGGTLPNEVSSEDFDNLKLHFSESEIVEIVATVALFGYLNRWNDTMATELEELPAQVTERAVGAKNWNAGKHI